MPSDRRSADAAVQRCHRARLIARLRSFDVTEPDALCRGVPALVFAITVGVAGCTTRDPSPSLSAQSLELRPPTLDEAFADLPRDRPLPIALETDQGALHCELDPLRTPHAVALFVGLATGRATFLDPATRRIVRRPLYQNLTFHRAVAGVLLQSGDPVGDASGNPGYRIAVEPCADDAQRLAQPGALVLARYTSPPGRSDPHPPPTGHVLGSQFAVLLTAMPHLVGEVSVIGRCRDLPLANQLAEDVAHRTREHRLLNVRVR